MYKSSIWTCAISPWLSLVRFKHAAPHGIVIVCIFTQASQRGITELSHHITTQTVTDTSYTDDTKCRHPVKDIVVG